VPHVDYAQSRLGLEPLAHGRPAPGMTRHPGAGGERNGRRRPAVALLKPTT
jgi:hypothetical protein